MHGFSNGIGVANNFTSRKWYINHVYEKWWYFDHDLSSFNDFKFLVV